MGNVSSVVNMLRKLGVEPALAATPEAALEADRLILPGVGAFDNAMIKLRESGLAGALHEYVERRARPLLGICLGMQLLGRGSEEGSLDGFGWVDAHARRFPAQIAEQKLRIPNMGWNAISVVRPSRLLADLEQEARFYFVHSYFMACEDPGVTTAVAEYGFKYTACLESGCVYGAQFHPEKSHRFGLILFRNFLAL
jgi:glutamine amidotransferase